MILFHGILHENYVLVLAPDTAPTGWLEAELAAHLDRACRSGRSVWVDCRLLETISATTAWLLWACQHRLQRRHRPLVLCRVLPPVEQILRQIFTGTDLRLSDDLNDLVSFAQRDGSTAPLSYQFK